MPPLRGRWKFIRSVFLMMPRWVAITSEGPGVNSRTGRMVANFSPSPKGSRLTMALPWAVGDPMGISWTLSQNTRPLLVNTRKKLWVEAI